MGVDELIVRAAVGGRFHGVLEAIEGEEDRGAGWGGYFGPEGKEDGVADVGVADAELGEAEERDVGLERDGEGVLLSDLEVRKDCLVGFGYLTEQICCVDILGIERWCRVCNWRVVG